MLKTKIIRDISEIVDFYEVYFIDLWGVIHNGVKLFPGVNDVLKVLKKKKKTIFFITNAPRRATIISKQLKELGIDNNVYDRIVSSGEITWYFLEQKIKKTKKKLRFYHIGPPRDDHLKHGLNFEESKNLEEVDLIINTGPWGDNDKLENYVDILDCANKYSIPMICSNPDKTVIRGDNFMICAGMLAEYYENIGGSVEYYGKPYSEIYNYCFQHLSDFDKKKVLFIGDSLDNDIKGANIQKCDSLLITNGIHRDINKTNDNEIDKIKMIELLKGKKIFPNYASFNFCYIDK